MRSSLPATAFTLCALALGACTVHAQRRDASMDVPVAADVTLQVGKETYRGSGPTECKAARDASIYGIPALLFSVAQTSGKDSMRLSVWQPKNGTPDMMALHVALGGKSYEVDTVQAGTKRDTKGSGQAKFAKVRVGGTFTIDAVADDGTKITGTVTCSRFTGIVAEGG